MKNGFYKKVLMNMPEGVLILDKDFNIIFCNEWFTNLVKKEVKGKIGDYLVDYTFDPIKKDYDIKKFDVKVDDELIALKTTTKKISEDYVILTSLIKECICLDVVHNDFISTVSHEIRTPLTSMKGFIDTILISKKQLSDAQQERFLNIVKQQIQRLTRLVENLLTVSRLDNKKIEMTMRAVDLPAIVKQVAIELQSKYTDYVFEIKGKGIPKIWVDYDKMHQILINLLDNACKYSPDNKKIEINLKNINEKKVQIEIVDKGIGIAPEFLDKIFNKFLRIDTPLTQQVQGTGLGLYITKTLVNSLGGDIEVKSTLGVGSSFVMEFPAISEEVQLARKFKCYDK